MRESSLFEMMVAFIQETHRAAQAALADEAVSPAQFFVLRSLHGSPALSQAVLAQALGVTPANVSLLLDKLESAGYVQRTGEGRSKRVALTPLGRRLVLRLAPQHEAFLRERFAVLTASERKALGALLQKLGAS